MKTSKHRGSKKSKIGRKTQSNRCNIRGSTLNLVLAASQGKTRKVKQLVGQGADVNKRCIQKNAEYFPLYAAAQSNHVDIMKYLLDHGADINLKTKKGVTSLRTTIHRNHVAGAKLLLKRGIKVSKVDKQWVDYYSYYNKKRYSRMRKLF